MSEATSFDLSSYLRRVGLAEAEPPGEEALARLQRAHLAAIPFENLDVRLGRPVGIDLESLQSKLVRRRRGGYCFEQNTLFVAALRALGYRVETLEARVRPPGATAALPRTHMALLVELPSGPQLADVGFGGDGALVPVPLAGTEVEAGGDRHRVERENDGFVLRRRVAGGWVDQYAFLTKPALPVDFLVAHHFTSTHPRSIFVQSLTVQRATATERLVLRGRIFVERRGEQAASREVDAAAAYELLRGRFDLDVTAEEVERALAAG